MCVLSFVVVLVLVVQVLFCCYRSSMSVSHTSTYSVAVLDESSSPSKY